METVLNRRVSARTEFLSAPVCCIVFFFLEGRLVEQHKATISSILYCVFRVLVCFFTYSRAWEIKAAPGAATCTDAMLILGEFLLDLKLYSFVLLQNEKTAVISFSQRRRCAIFLGRKLGSSKNTILILIKRWQSRWQLYCAIWWD